jgi:hypothetical protein
MLPRAARFAGGLALGIALWWIATPAYNRLLCAATEPLLHIDRRLAAAALVPQERSVFVTSSTPLPTATIPADQLTYNVILLFALFAAEGPATRGAYMRALAIAALILIAAHCITLVIAIESTYAARQGAWSELHYGEAAASFWLTAELVMRIVGMFGVVFASWWALAHSKSVST